MNKYLTLLSEMVSMLITTTHLPLNVVFLLVVSIIHTYLFMWRCAYYTDWIFAVLFFLAPDSSAYKAVRI